MKTIVKEYRNNHCHSVDFDFHIEGLELVENPDGLHVGAHFQKAAPKRKGKPGLWQRVRFALYRAFGGKGSQTWFFQ